MAWGEPAGGMTTVLEELLSNDDARRQIVDGVVKRLTPAEIAHLLCKADGDTMERLRHHLGCRCKHHKEGGCHVDEEKLICKLKGELSCRNRRLSVIEEERKRANRGGVVDIPVVNGANGTVSLTVPAYGVEYFLTSFSTDGSISQASGSLSRVEFILEHAGWVFAEFRASEYKKESCCTTVVDAFKEKGMCFGWESTWTIRVTNRNTNANETYINGILSYTRGFP